jgi:glutamine synthetase
VFLLGVLKGVHKRSGLLRSTVASSGNDHRLGANEAPPAIISAFLGEQLNRILDSIEKGAKENESTEKRILSLGISALPAVNRDYTDRNRTSPFAFTGNKFEFRAVGAAFTISTPLAVLNAAVAEGLDDVGRQLKDKLKDGAPLERAVMEVVKAAITETRAIRFEGNNYSQDWVAEAAKRGLPNARTTPEALEFMGNEDDKKFLEKHGVLSPAEAESRYHVKLERYIKDIEIEAQALEDMVDTMVLPAAYRYSAELGKTLDGLTKAGLDKKVTARPISVATAVAEAAAELGERVDALRGAIEKANGVADLARKARTFSEGVVPALAAIRETSDKLEELVPDDLWPLPKYREMLFIV